MDKTKVANVERYIPPEAKEAGITFEMIDAGRVELHGLVEGLGPFTARSIAFRVYRAMERQRLSAGLQSREPDLKAG